MLHHRGTEALRRECFVNFTDTEYRFREIHETLLEGR